MRHTKSIHSSDGLQDLDKLLQWSKVWLIRGNPRKKCTVMKMGNNKTRPVQNYHLVGCKLEKSTCPKCCKGGNYILGNVDIALSAWTRTATLSYLPHVLDPNCVNLFTHGLVTLTLDLEQLIRCRTLYTASVVQVWSVASHPVTTWTRTRTRTHGGTLGRTDAHTDACREAHTHGPWQTVACLVAGDIQINRIEK